MKIHEIQPYEIGKDIWIRARTNAFANELAVANLTHWENSVFIIRVFFIVIPIVLVSLSVSSFSTKISVGQTELELTTFHIFSFLSIISNGIALFLTIISVRLRWAERSFQYKEQLALFSMIAQKSRRLEDIKIKKQEGFQLCRQLHELFETTKSKGLEPNNKYFTKAKQMIADLNTYPFGLKKDDFKD
jgi:hypothetical protein